MPACCRVNVCLSLSLLLFFSLSATSYSQWRHFCVTILVPVSSSRRLMWFLYVAYKTWGKIRTQGCWLNIFHLLNLLLQAWTSLLFCFFLPQPIICIFRCESPWCFYFPIKCFPEKHSFTRGKMFCWSRLESTGGPISSFAVYDASFCHFWVVVFFLLFLWRFVLSAWVLFLTWANCIYPTFMCCVHFLFFCYSHVTSSCLSGDVYDVKEGILH